MSSIVSINGAPLSIKILPDMYEVVTGLARTTQLVGVPLIDINFNLDTFYSRVLKRIFDVILSIVGILICLPIWISISLLIKIDSVGPILYLQSRSGKDGKLFNIIKIRSMVSNAESDTGPVWAGKKDSRITRIGRLLRRFHIDETPQLINILKGDMSIIGPRPERPFFIEKLKETYPFYRRRLKIRPGVSGWAQINQPFDTNVKDVHQKLKYDFYYIENLSLRLDAHILFRTLWVVLRGHPK
ncbi:MAG: exopolysaccharide biosynthesis polyprenyl glycosylphosphotransferase [Candidatus Neomarinimicrobiota bacterium]